MDLLDNPLYYLNATLNDCQEDLARLAREKSLTGDSALSQRALSRLIQPEDRLAAEVAWLPGVDSMRVKQLLSLLENEYTALICEDHLPGLAQANLLAAALNQMKDSDMPLNGSEQFKVFETALISLLISFYHIDLQEVLELLNDARQRAGLPEITDIDSLARAISIQAQYFVNVMIHCLDKMNTGDLVAIITGMSEYCAANFQRSSDLMDKVIVSYEAEAQVFLEKEKNNINILLASLRQNVEAQKDDAILKAWAVQLKQVLQNWHMVARPIQINYESRGLTHRDSVELANTMRSLARLIANQHQKIWLALSLTRFMDEAFQPINAIIHAHAADQVKWEESAKTAWEKEMSYSAPIGQGVLVISSTDIQWKDRRWPLESIRSIRWGPARVRFKGIALGTVYGLGFANELEREAMLTRSQRVYQELTERLWKGVGERLLSEFLIGLREGKRYSFAKEIVDDVGIEFEGSMIIKARDRIYAPWDDVAYWNKPGFLCITHPGARLTVELSYKNIDNLHILEAALSRRSQGANLSSLMERND